MVRTPTLVVLTATLIIWAAVAGARILGGPDVAMLEFGLVVAVGSTVALWLVWAFVLLEQFKKQADRGKSKRAPAEEDVRLSLLLQMLDEGERQSLKQRLRDDVNTDGEALALDDLLKERRAR